MSVSELFFTPSLQLGAAHFWLVHTPLAQSEAEAQAMPVPHLGQLVAPPQSTPVSAPFLTPSLQRGATHF
jgi:hypothetical protein